MSYRISCAFLFVILLGCSDRTEKLFLPAISETSGIHFANKITIGDSLTLTGFEYIYNGGGVAIGDINNDGLEDIYFTGNMVSSRLYLNKGNLKFEDITEKAGVGTRVWANGVVMADVNQDGFKDIYVTVGGTRYTKEADRANLLFINRGDGTFKESAAQYGIDDRGYGIQSTFLDYDLDGDLDLYVLRNAFVSYSRNIARPKAVHGEGASNDRLFRNNGNGTFTDVTKEAGILIEGFGLGVTVSDLNEDGWPDIYVSNDFITNDLIWLNNQDGTFTNVAGKYLKHQTFNGMGNDVADYNNDGKVDIVELDMLPEDNKRWKLTPRGNSYDEFQNGLSMGYEPQYVRNTLQLNNGNGTFSEIGQLAGIEATEWSWSALFADYDNDGLKDLFITNGYGKDITNLDFIVYGDQEQGGGLPRADAAERQRMLNELPGIKIHDYIYRNKGDLTFANMTEAWGMSAPNFSNGAAYADLDNDGDLDLVINNMDDEATLMINQANQLTAQPHAHFLRFDLHGPTGNREGFGAKVTLRNQGLLQYQYFTPVHGYLSSVEPFLHFGVGTSTKMDTVEVVWPDGKFQLLTGVATDQVLKLDYQKAVERKKSIPPDHAVLFEEVSQAKGVSFRHEENTFVDFKVQPLLPHMHSRNGPGVAVGDINGDGLEDFYIGTAAGQKSGMYWQVSDGKFVFKPLVGADTLSDKMGVLLFDADQDRDLDLLVTAGGSEQAAINGDYRQQIFLNDGHGGMTLASDALPALRQSISCAVAADYDHDGDLDVFLGGRLLPGEYPRPGKSSLLQNNGHGKFKEADLAGAASLADAGMVCAALWTDYDNDGWVDLVVTGEFMPIRFYHNEEGKLKDVTDKSGLENSSGWWNSLVGGDFDGDGDIDYLAGNLGLNSHFHASADEPLCVYANDFNKDGLLDPVLSYYVEGVKYIGHPRNILIDQINTMRGRFRTYTDYSNATFDESFTPEEIETSYVLCAQNFQSSYIENLGHGNFKISALLLRAQFAPVYGMVTGDYNDDGNLDVLLVGNSYSPEVISGRDDASIGLYLKGDGKGSFSPSSVTDSGFLADRDAKGMARLVTGAGEELVIIGNNNSMAQVYSRKGQSEYCVPGPGDSFAMVKLRNGKSYKQEFYWGSTYLSQSSFSIRLGDNIAAVELYDARGKLRETVTSKRKK